MYGPGHLCSVKAVGVETWALAVQVPEECPAEIEQLIDLCLATDSADRPTAKQAFDIIGACSLTPPPPVHPTSPPQQDVASLGAVESGRCPTAPGTEGVEVVHVSEVSMGVQREKSMGSLLRPAAHSVHSTSQPPTVADGTLANMPAPRHQGPVMGHDNTLTAWLQSPSGQVSTATWSDHSGVGHQSPFQQQGGGEAKHSMCSSSDAGVATWPTAERNHLANGSLPLGVYGHLYPSPFAMADDDSGGSLWCWQHRQAAPGVGSDQDSAEPQG